ncbi:MAG: hypothetical protein JST11_17240 [Acidobacteria bacterium]|nr:hypothetical protein [Acidobacteriota bacterium]
MKLPWRSRKRGVRVESTRVVASRVSPGVRYRIAAMSFARRVELMTRVRDLARRMEFLASSEDAAQKMDGALLRAEIDRVYVKWGLRDVEGLTVDGQKADPALLAEAGPEELFREALTAVRAETGLNEEERKN